ncbi:hypothetical protein FIA58_013190 [Flavobacterium jejuense]|uniref:Uncharacterized protein n=1 Tax=Flavobacterium jejuense TaxID=1544455 RepID=A0ABX0IXY2_9FLAO|nr:hypothetical protein [Flavobacterium jejuense]NHN26634.1 hypothetical protein [Flavobacterium jejuense]
MKKNILEIENEIKEYASQNKGKYNLIFEKIRSYNHKSSDYTEDYYEFQSYMRDIMNSYFDQMILEYEETKNNELKKDCIVIADYLLDRRYDILIRLDDEEAFEIVLQYAEDFLKGEDFIFFQRKYVNGESLFALAEAYSNPKFKERVVAFFIDAFQLAKKYAKERDKSVSTRVDPDGDTLFQLCSAITSLNQDDREQFSKIVFDIYTFSSNSKRRSYELSQASGFIALLLPYYQASFDMKIFDEAINITGKFYKENTFVHQTLYAKWILEKNAEEALDYYLNEENNKWPHFAIMALTDLSCKEALPFFIEKQKETKDPVLWEIYEEAIQRLKNNYKPLQVEDRMILLNGNVTPTQRALGTESNNFFVQRAQKKINIDDTVYETDDDLL